MIDFLKSVPTWFLILCVSVLCSFSLWLVSRSIGKLDQTIDRFQELIDRLFNKYDDHENRLSRLEGKCEANHD